MVNLENRVGEFIIRFSIIAVHGQNIVLRKWQIIPTAVGIMCSRCSDLSVTLKKTEESNKVARLPADFRTKLFRS